MLKKIEQWIYFILIGFQLKDLWENRFVWKHLAKEIKGPFRFDNDNWSCFNFYCGAHLVSKRNWFSGEFSTNSNIWNKEFSEYLSKLIEISDREKESKRLKEIEEKEKKENEIKELLNRKEEK